MTSKTFRTKDSDNENNAIRVSALFKKEGINWANSKHERGGFYLSFSIGQLRQMGEYSTFTTEMFSGFKVFVKPGKRDSQKTREAIISLVSEEVAKAAFEKDMARLFDIIKSNNN